MRRVMERDPDNIQSVGFAPLAAHKPMPTGATTLSVMAQFGVRRIRKQVADAKRISSIESVRLLDRSAQQFDEVDLVTDVEETAPVVPTGVRISTEAAHATTAVIIRWTTTRPVPPPPVSDAGPQDPRWRWGVLTVSHLFAGSDSGRGQSAEVQRRAACKDGPEVIRGRVVARGRIPGGPDVGLVETGLDRLWLSGFLPRIGVTPIQPATEPDLLKWIAPGTAGVFFADDANCRWRWKTFYPQMHIDGLGNLEHVVRYELVSDGSGWDDAASHSPNTRSLGLGSSGGVLVSGGIPIGIQVAAMKPRFQVGYAQTLESSLPWLKSRLRASSLAIVNIVTGG